MKKILILSVTYNSYKELNGYLTSIEKAASFVQGTWLIDVCVGDNTEEHTLPIQSHFTAIHHLRLFPFHENLGYFGAAQRMMSEINDLAEYDYVVISNVDLKMPEDFFVKLNQLKVLPQTGWVANAIISGLECRDRNPKVMRRYSERRLKQLRFLFKYPILHYLYQHTLYLRKRAQAQKVPMEIYAGHGSFILLTKAFFSKCPKLSYRPFLFCEEIYLAELCRLGKLSVQYEPSVEIYDTEHCSTGKMRKSQYYKYNFDAINFILQEFYK